MYYRYLDNNKDKDILLIHSFPSSSLIFDCHIPHLAQHFNILLVDLPGFGRSSDLEFSNIEEVSESIRAIISKERIKHLTVWGLSFGGVVAISLAQKQEIELLILESSPLRSNLIHTVELKILSSIERILTKFNWSKGFQELIRTSKIFRKTVLFLYHFVNFGKKIAPEMALENFILKLNMNAIFKVNTILKHFDVTSKLENVKTKIIGIYDLNDPVIPFKQSTNILKKKEAQILKYDFNTHCPSLTDCDTVTTDIIMLIK